MKNCIGKDLSRIPVPVNFSEPLSMLQRMSEDLQYSEILAKAALSRISKYCKSLDIRCNINSGSEKLTGTGIRDRSLPI